MVYNYPTYLWSAIIGGLIMRECMAKVSSEKVIFDIMNERNDVVYIDLRDLEQYQRFTLPGAINMRPEEVLDRKYRAFFRKDPREKIFFSDGTSISTRVWAIGRRVGYQNLHILDGGLNGIFEMLFTEKPEEKPNDYMYGFSKRFVKEARQLFQEGGGVKPWVMVTATSGCLLEVSIPSKPMC
jgi:rhodanese-related sulfurtransferase